jgi:hypothetical protein
MMLISDNSRNMINCANKEVLTICILTLTFTIEREILKAQEEIQKLKEELHTERIIRKNKEEYDLLAAQINSIPSIEETQRFVSCCCNLKILIVYDRSIKQLEEESERLKKESDQCTAKVDLRTKQFALLLYAIRQLEQQVEDDGIADIQLKQQQQVETLKKEQLKQQEQKRTELKFDPDTQKEELEELEGMILFYQLN